MNKSKTFFIVIISIVLLGAFATPASAQTNDIITAEVDRTAITTDDILLLTVSVDAAAGNASDPALPALDGFNVIGTSSGTQISLINGAFSMKATYRYQLQASRMGDLIIDPISVAVEGNIFSTQPIQIRVSQGTGQPSAPSGSPPFSGLPSFPSFPSFPAIPGLPSMPTQPVQPTNPVQPGDPVPAPYQLAGQEFFVEAEVSDVMPYQGEQVLYTFRFYQATNLLDQPQYQAPAFTGLWSNPEPEQYEYSVQAAGRNYRVTELRTILFPTVVGQVAIDPATLSIPGGFFSRGQSLATQSIVLDVQPLPNTAPADFQGAVGSYTIRTEADALQAKVNDTVTVNVVVEGVGNVEAMPDPVWSESNEWRAFDSEATVQTSIVEGKVYGSRIYERLLVPTVAGELVLPAIQYSFFDPELNEYVTVASDPIVVDVLPDGSLGTNAPTLPAVDTGVGSVPPSPADVAIRPLKSASPFLKSGNPLLATKAGYWLLWSVPLLLLAAHTGLRMRQNHRLNNVDERRSQQAAKQAHKALRQARHTLKSSSDETSLANDEVARILSEYLSSKLGRSIHGLTQIDLVSLLQARGVDLELAERVENCFIKSEMGRYAPIDVSESALDILEEADELVDDLDKAI